MLGGLGNYGKSVAEIQAVIDTHKASIQARHDRNDAYGDPDENHLGISAWAEGQNDDLYRIELLLAARGWSADFVVLQDLEGNDVPDARVFVNQFNQLAWLVKRPDGTVFAPYRPVRESTLEKKGFREVLKSFPAYARHDGGGKGTAGMLNVHVAIFPHPEAAIALDERRGTIYSLS